MIFESGPYCLDIYVEKTQEFYAKNGAISCECEGCQNFKQAVSHLPEEVNDFFTQFGVDPTKPAEICAHHSADGIQTLYSGFYHICGSILSGKNPWVQVAKKQFHLNKEYSIKLSDDFSFYFTEECMLVDENFPAPVIQMEFTGNLPWVIEKHNPYT